MWRLILVVAFGYSTLASDLFEGIEQNQPVELVTESRVDDRIQYAVMENDRREHFSALQSLRAAVNETGFKSAKASYFLARQYQMMEENGIQSDSNQSFRTSMRFHLLKASKLKNSHLNQYPSNAIYAVKSTQILKVINNIR